MCATIIASHLADHITNSEERSFDDFINGCTHSYDVVCSNCNATLGTTSAVSYNGVCLSPC